MTFAEVITGIFYATLSLSPLMIFGSVGEIISEKSGVADLGIEGIMLMSAFVTLATSVLSGNPWVGILAGVSIGVAMGAVYGYLAIGLYLDQIACGLSIYLFGLGLSYVLFTIFSKKYVGIPTFKGIGTSLHSGAQLYSDSRTHPISAKYHGLRRAGACARHGIFSQADKTRSTDKSLWERTQPLLTRWASM